MFQKVAILFGLIVSATCMVLHQAPLPLYLPHQYQDQAPGYNYGYEANNPNNGEFNNLQESRRGDSVLGQYPLPHTDGISRTFDYRAEDNSGFNGNNNRQNNEAVRHVDNINDVSRRPNNVGPQANQPWSSPKIQLASPTPVTITQTSVYHQTYSHGHNSWN